MELVKKELMVPKELNDVGVAVVTFLKAVLVDKKPTTQALTEDIPAILAAVDGFQGITEEVKDVKALIAFGASLGVDLSSVFIK